MFSVSVFHVSSNSETQQNIQFIQQYKTHKYNNSLVQKCNTKKLKCNNQIMQLTVLQYAERMSPR